MKINILDKSVFVFIILINLSGINSCTGISNRELIEKILMIELPNSIEEFDLFYFKIEEYENIDTYHFIKINCDREDYLKIFNLLEKSIGESLSIGIADWDRNLSFRGKLQPISKHVTWWNPDPYSLSYEDYQSEYPKGINGNGMIIMKYENGAVYCKIRYLGRPVEIGGPF